MTTKVDFKKELASYRARQGVFELIDVPELQYLMIDGHGDPNTSPSYQQALETLYPVAYKLKFASKHELSRDYVVPPLEGLWWAEDMRTFTTTRDKGLWKWTLMLMTPDWIAPSMFDDVVDQVGRAARPPRLDDVRLETLEEGLCVQTLHVGSFDDEAPVLERMHHEFIPEQGLRMTGKHHEVYLSDVRKVAPERLRTVLRQPVARA